MRRTMNFDTLNEYLTAAHVTVMLCRAHADQFDLDQESSSDIEFRISQHISELEDLRHQVLTRNVSNRRAAPNGGGQVLQMPRNQADFGSTPNLIPTM
jgi:hypothetical protein